MNSYINIFSTIIVASVFTLAGGGAAYGGSRNITPAEARKMIASNDGDLLILDVRTEREYRGPDGHIRGARLIPIRSLPARIGEIDEYRDGKIIVYCAVGGRSAMVADFLAEKGFRKIYNMVGGIKEWNRLGYVAERE